MNIEQKKEMIINAVGATLDEGFYIAGSDC